MNNTGTEFFERIACNKNNNFTESKGGYVTFRDDEIKLAINEIIINKLQSEKANIENIAMSVIAKYKTKLTEHINEKIYNKLIGRLDNFLKSELEQKDITRKIVLANVKNFETLMVDEESDKSLKTNYTNLLKLGNICTAEKVAVANKIAADAKALAEKAADAEKAAAAAETAAETAAKTAADARKKADETAAAAAENATSEKAKTVAKKAAKEAKTAAAAEKKAAEKAEKARKEADETVAAAKTAENAAAAAAAEAEKAAAEKNGGSTLIHKKTHTRKSNKKKRERKTRRIRGGAECIDVKAICKKVTSLISTQNQLFMNTTEIELTGVAELKEKIVKVCLRKTDEILDQIAKQAIDYGALNEILKYLIVEMTNLVKSNMRNSKDFLCKNV